MLSYLGNVGGERAMQEMARTDSRVERMMQLESLFTKDPTLLRDYFITRRDRADYENSFRQARTDEFAESSEWLHWTELLGATANYKLGRSAQRTHQPAGRC